MDLSAQYNLVMHEVQERKQHAYEAARLCAYTLKQAMRGVGHTGRIEHLEPKAEDAVQVVEFDVFKGGGGDPDHDEYRRSRGVIEIYGSGLVRISMHNQDEKPGETDKWEATIQSVSYVQLVTILIARIQEMDVEGLIGPVLAARTPVQKQPPSGYTLGST